MDIKNIKAKKSTTTVDRKILEEKEKNIYLITVIIGKRAEQINIFLKQKLDEKLQNFITPINDNLEEIHENKEQIEISKLFEKLPKPSMIALEEFMNDKIKYEFKKNNQ
jgi:DNA-directed RNA polymerase subunit K/omega